MKDKSERKVKSDQKEQTKNQIKSGLYFLGIVLLIMIGTLFLDPGKTVKALHYSLKLFINIIPIIVAVIIFISITNFFVDQKKLSLFLGKESGIKGWIIIIIAGIITHGPIYVWFNMLKEMRKHGMRTGFIAIFLYNRAIKLPLIPIMIYYFGTLYTVTLMIVMIITSPIIGFFVEFATRKDDLKEGLNTEVDKF